MKIQQWISGKELMERWKIKPLDLVEAVLFERLTAYEADGKLAKFDHESVIWANHTGPWPPWPKVENQTIYDFILNPQAYDFEMPPISIPPDYIPLASRIEHCMFKLSEVKYFEKNNLILQNTQQEENDTSSLEKEIKQKKKRKKTNLQICREKVREEAIFQTSRGIFTLNQYLILSGEFIKHRRWSWNY